MRNLLKDITRFVEESTEKKMPSRQHFMNDDVMIYMRVTRHYIDGELKNTIDISTISVNEDKMGKGIFKKICSHIEDLADKHKRCVYIESVINADFQAHISRRGYRKTGSDMSPDFHRPWGSQPDITLG